MIRAIVGTGSIGACLTLAYKHNKDESICPSIFDWAVNKLKTKRQGNFHFYNGLGDIETVIKACHSIQTEPVQIQPMYWIEENWDNSKPGILFRTGYAKSPFIKSWTSHLLTKESQYMFFKVTIPDNDFVTEKILPKLENLCSYNKTKVLEQFTCKNHRNVNEVASSGTNRETEPKSLTFNLQIQKASDQLIAGIARSVIKISRVIDNNFNDQPIASTNVDDFPMAVLLPSIGEENLTRLTTLADDLALNSGIGTILLENPFRGRRRLHSHKWTTGSILAHANKEENHDTLPTPRGHPLLAASISDLIAMGSAVIQESRLVLTSLHNLGFKALSVGGASMGGEMGIIASQTSPFPVGTIALLPAHSTCAPFVDGILATVSDWSKVRDSIIERNPYMVSDELDAKKIETYLRKVFEVTDCTKQPAPVAPECLALLYARADQYMPAWSAKRVLNHFNDALPEGEYCTNVHSTSGGHCWNFLTKQRFTHMISESLSCVQKFNSNGDTKA